MWESAVPVSPTGIDGLTTSTRPFNIEATVAADWKCVLSQRIKARGNGSAQIAVIEVSKTSSKDRMDFIFSICEPVSQITLPLELRRN